MGVGLFVGCFLVFLIVRWVARKINYWLYESKLGATRYELPPGDLGLPLIGNMWSFLRAFKSNNPESFVSDLLRRSVLKNDAIFKFLFIYQLKKKECVCSYIIINYNC